VFRSIVWAPWMTVFVLISLCAPVRAEESASAPLAQELSALLEQRQLDSVAAPMPGEKDRFVAALYYANAQLLVVSARYPVPSLLREQVWTKKYRDVYTQLHGGGLQEGKFFVVDLDADGFAPMGDAFRQIDVIYDDGVRQTTLNGDWRSQQLSKAEYAQRLEAADRRYAKMLAALVVELKAGT
jgi:hypothetical protein